MQDKLLLISYLSKEEIIFILNSLGVEITSPKKNFRLREDDKTPSASIYIKNGKVRIHDFGIDFDGDIIDVLKEFFGLSFKEAIDYILQILGIKDNKLQVDFYKKEFEPVKENHYLTPIQIEKEWNKYSPLTSLSNLKMQEVINKLIPYEYFTTATERNRKAFLKSIKYDKYQDEPVVATYTPNGEILTIRHRRYKLKNGEIIKWKSLKDTKANAYSQIRIKHKDEPVFIIEGTHDYIVAELLGINFIALPNRCYRKFKDEELAILGSNKFDFVILPDLDFKNETDEKYQKFKKELDETLNNFLIPQLKPFIREIISIWNLKKRFSYFKGIEKIKDLSDMCLVSDIYDSIYFKTFHLLSSFIAEDLTDENLTKLI